MLNKDIKESMEKALMLAMHYLVEGDLSSVAEYISQARSFIPYIHDKEVQDA